MNNVFHDNCFYFNENNFCDIELIFDTQDILNNPGERVQDGDFESAKKMVDFLLQKVESENSAGFAANQWNVPMKIISFNTAKEKAKKFTNLLFQFDLINYNDRDEKLSVVEDSKKLPHANDDSIEFDHYLASYSYMINPVILEKKRFHSSMKRGFFFPIRITIIMIKIIQQSILLKEILILLCNMKIYSKTFMKLKQKIFLPVFCNMKLITLMG